jgi:hypothetical protein
MLAALALTGGCLKQTEPVAVVNRAPLIVDDAMQQRHWTRSVARFQNGETPSAPTGFILAHAPNTPKWTPLITDGPLFLANVFVMPVGYVFTPSWTRVIYPSGVVEPSFTGVPPQER